MEDSNESGKIDGNVYKPSEALLLLALVWGALVLRQQWAGMRCGERNE